MKLWTSEYTFTHPWETVTTAVWRKYPNPHNPKIIGTDVFDRKVVNGVLHSSRLISSDWGLQTWVKKLIGSEKINYGRENSSVDPANKTMVLNTTNISFTRNISCDETLTYRPHPDNPNHTQLVQTTTLKCFGVPFVAYCEQLLKNIMTSNADKGRVALEWVINKIDSEVFVQPRNDHCN